MSGVKFPQLVLDILKEGQTVQTGFIRCLKNSAFIAIDEILYVWMFDIDKNDDYQTFGKVEKEKLHNVTMQTHYLEGMQVLYEFRFEGN